MATRDPNREWFIEEKPSVRNAEPGEYLFHYTTLAAALEHILPTRRLRFSKFSTMRDPRESKWAVAASMWGEEGGTNLYFETLATLEHLKETVRIISFTADDEKQAFIDGVFTRGFLTLACGSNTQAIIAGYVSASKRSRSFKKRPGRIVRYATGPWSTATARLTLMRAALT